MKARNAWTIDGAETAQTREHVEAAARRSGLSLGAWLDNLIAEAVAESERNAPKTSAAPSRRRASRASRPEGGELSAILGTLTGLAERVGSAEQAARSALELARQRLADDPRDSSRHARDLRDSDRRVESAREDLFAVEEDARRTLRDVMERTRAFRAARPDRDEDDPLSTVAVAVSTLERRIDEMMRKLDAREAAPAAPRDDSRLLAQIRARLDELARRTEAPRPVEGKIAESLRGLDQRLSELAQRAAAGAHKPTKPVHDERLARIEAQLSGLIERFSRPEKAGARRPATFREQVAWEAGGEGGPVLEEALRQILEHQKKIEAQIDPTVLYRAIDERLQEATNDIVRRIGAGEKVDIDPLRAEIRALADTVDAARGIAVDPGEIQALQRQLDALHQAVDGIAARMPLDDVLGGLEVLADSLDTLDRSGRAMEGGIDEIRRSLQGVAQRGDIEPLQDGLRFLAQRIEASIEQRDDPANRLDAGKLDRLSTQLEDMRGLIAETNRADDIRTLAEEVRALDRKVEELRGPDTDSISAIEILHQDIAEIGKKLEDEWSTRRMLETARSSSGQQVSDGLAEVVLTLKDALADMRAAQGGSEQRIQAALGSVHDTLRSTADRLSRLEGARFGDPATPPPPPLDLKPAPEPARASPEARRDGKAIVAAAREAAAQAANLGPRSSRVSPDLPLEPGSGKPRPGKAAESAKPVFDPISPRDPAPESMPSGGSEKPGAIRQSFIAAIRRSASPAATNAPAPAKPKPEKPVADLPAAFVPAPKAEPPPEPRIDIRPDPKPEKAKAPVVTPKAAKTEARAPQRISALGDAPTPQLKAAPASSKGKWLLATTAAVLLISSTLATAWYVLGTEPRAVPRPVALAESTTPRETPPAPTAASTMTTGSVSLSAAPAPAPAARQQSDIPAIPEGLAPPRLAAAAAAGDGRALYEIGNRLAEAQGSTRDPAAAIHWWRLAADRGHAPSIYRLGNAFEKGTGVERDMRQAMQFYQQAADLGNRKAIHNLAALLATGADGGRPDYERAFPLFLRAAEYNLVDSQYNVGVLYQNGLGTRANLSDAYTWFQIAAQNGDRAAATKRDEVARRLDATALVNARLAAQSFTPRALDPAANEEIIPPSTWEDPSARVSEAPVQARPNLGINVGAAQPARN